VPPGHYSNGLVRRKDVSVGVDDGNEIVDHDVAVLVDVLGLDLDHFEALSCGRFVGVVMVASQAVGRDDPPDHACRLRAFGGSKGERLLLRPLRWRCRHFIALSDLIDRQAVERRCPPSLALHHASENTRRLVESLQEAMAAGRNANDPLPADAVTASTSTSRGMARSQTRAGSQPAVVVAVSCDHFAKATLHVVRRRRNRHE